MRLWPREAPLHLDDGAYQLFMLAVSVIAIGILGITTAAELQPETQQLLEYADNAICVLFFGDFLYQLARAEHRWNYFIRWGWIDLLSSIPVVDAFRTARAVRIVRILRILRAAKSARILADFLLRRRAQGAILAAALLTLVLVVFSSIAILQFEETRGGNITTAEDAIWWTVVTLTTVGYGDHYPVTFEGRLVAVLLMSAGIGLFGTFSGFVASWFLKPGEQQQDDHMDEVRSELAELKRMVAALGPAQDRGPGQGPPHHPASDS